MTKTMTNLVNSVLSSVQEMKNRGEIKEVTTEKPKVNVEGFTYDTKSGMPGYRISLGKEVVKEPDISQINSMVSLIKDSTQYADARRQISEFKSVEESQADLWLLTFISRIVMDLLKKGTEWMEAFQTLHAFLNDLADGPMEWHIKTHVSGVSMSAMDIALGKGVRIKRIAVEDVLDSYESPFGFYSMPPQNVGTAVLEIDTVEKIQPMVFPMKDKLTLLLLLFRRGSVKEIKTIFNANSIIRWPGRGTSFPNLQLSAGDTYVLRQEDGKALQSFVESLMDKLPVDLNGQIIMNDYIGIALARYQDSMLKPEAFFNRIGYSVMGLEALFLKENEREELSLRLSQRVSKLIAVCTEGNVIEIFNIVKTAYDIRSSFVHGAFYSQKDVDQKSIFDRVSEYLREAIVASMILKESKEKEVLISLLDNSILDRNAEEKLKKLIIEKDVSRLIRL